MNEPARDRAALAYAMMRSGSGRLRTHRRLGGHGRRVYECEPERGAAIIARVVDKGPDAFDLEIAIAQRLREVGVPVPPFRDIIRTDAGGAQTVLFQEQSTGQTLRSRAPAMLPAERSRSVERSGELLARVHACTASGFGPLVSADHGQAVRLSDWFVDGIDAGALRVRNSDAWTARQTEEALALIEAHRTVIDGSSPGLLHGDWSPDNILVDSLGEPVAVVDLEAAKSGPPALDLGWWDCMFDSELTPSDALVRGYRRQGMGGDDRVLDALRHLTALRIALLFAAWAAGRPDVHSGWATERVCRELADAPRWSVV